MTSRRVATLGVAVVLAVSGTYFFVYLWRWEWNRAIVAGIIFLAAEIGMALALLLGRLGRLESRLGTGATTPREAEISATIRDTAPPPRDHFNWLTPRDGGFGVFVPLLMGMGVIVSGLAWVVERVARVSARPVLERRLASQLLPLAWPSGGVSGDRDAVPVAAHVGGRAIPPPPRPYRGVGAVVGLVALAGAVVVGVDALGDLTQDRADSVEPGSRSRIVLEVETQEPRDPSLIGNAERLWTLCQATVRNRTVDPGVVEVGDGRFLVVTEPAVGDHAWRRLQGCLEDMSIPRVNAKVVSKDDLPPPLPPGGVS